MVQVLFAEGLVDMGRLEQLCHGVSEVRELAADFAPQAVADGCGIAAEQIRRLARELAGAPRAAVYGRIGTCTQEFGSLASWLVGNPALSAPNAGRLEAALDGLELMVAVDIYVNETTRHADVILPVPSPLERSHYDLALYNFAVRNVANYTPASLPPPAGLPDEWETLLQLISIAAGQGPQDDVSAVDDLVAGEAARRECADRFSAAHGRDPAELLGELVDASGAPRRGPERILDLMLRCGPYGEGFGRRPDGLSLAVLEAALHGVDLGPLEPRLPEVLRTASGCIELAPA